VSQVLTDFRVKHPQYDGIEDDQLVTALHGKYYSQMPIEEFTQKIGYQAQPAHPTQGVQSVDEQSAMVAQPIQPEPAQVLPRETPMIDLISKKIDDIKGGHSMSAHEPSMWERLKSLGNTDSNNARAMNEWAARDIAKEEGIQTKEAYEKAGFSQPILNPEGRPTGQALAEGAGIVAGQLPEVPQAAVNSVLRVIRGGDETVDNNFLDDAINWTEPAKEENTDPNYQSFYGLGKSLGTSLASMGASITAAIAVGGTGAGAPLAPLAAIAAGGGVAYRSSKDEFLDRIKEKVDSESLKVSGRKLNQEEWSKVYSEMEGAAQKYGGWEAVTEGVSNLIFLRAIALPLKGFGKEALADAAGRAAKVMGTEQATETITGVGQSHAEEEAGLGKAKTVGEAFKEQVIQTGLITTLLGGGGAAGKATYLKAEEKIAPARAAGRELDAISNRAFLTEDPNFTDQQKAVEALKPNDAQHTLASGAKQKPQEESLPEVNANFDISDQVIAPITEKPEEEKPQKGTVKGLAVVEAPISEIKLSQDVPQFKDGAGKEGVVEPLGGTFERTGVAPIQIWVRKDGTKEVISGRHRLDLARRSGEETIPAQYHYESEGFDKVQAASLDAILNIREGQGKVKDYVEFIQANQFTEKEAAKEGILGRAIGKRAFTIATKGSETLITSHRADQVTDEGATKIANAAPNNEALQAVGIKAIQDGKTITVAENLVKAVASMTTDTQQESGDMFGFDDSAMKEAVDLAKKASKKQREIQNTLTAVTGAAKNPELAKKEGIDIKDPDAILKKVKFLKSKKKAWDNWHTNPKLLAELKGKPEIELTQETEADIAKREKQAEEAKQAEAKKQKAIDDKAQADKDAGGFVLAGSELDADQAMAHGQDSLFSMPEVSELPSVAVTLPVSDKDPRIVEAHAIDSGIMQSFENGQQAIEWLAKNAQEPVFKLIARDIEGLIDPSVVVVLPENSGSGKAKGSFLVVTNKKTGDIIKSYININENGYDEETVLHELIHIAVNQTIIKPYTKEEIEAVVNLTSIAKEIARLLDNKAYLDTLTQMEVNALKVTKGDLQEIVTYSLTSPSFQSALKKAPSRAGHKTLFDKLASAIKDLLGIHSLSDSLFARTIEASAAVVSAAKKVKPKPKKQADTSVSKMVVKERAYQSDVVDGSKWETGKPVTLHFARNTESGASMAPSGMDFGQKIEPSGEYMVVDESDMSSQKADKWVYGEITFNNPLVLEHKTTSSKGWKKDLSEMFGGKTKKALKNAIAKAGYDGVLTVEPYRKGYALSEAVNISGDKEQSGTIKAKPLVDTKKKLTTSQFSSAIKKQFPTVKFAFTSMPNGIVVDKIVVPESAREKGVGTSAMQAIIDLAQENGLTVALTPSSDFGGTKARLTKFYKNLGFVENKGKNKDYEISEAMYLAATKSPVKNTRTKEVAKDGVQYSRTFTPKQKMELLPANKDHAPLTEDKALSEVEGLAADQPNENNPPMFYELEAKGMMPDRVESFTLRGKTIKLKDVYNPQKREGIIAHVKSIIGNRLYNNRVKGKNVAGYYNTVNGELRMKKYGDIEVLAHEMAHYLDFYHEFRVTKNGKQYRRTIGDTDRAETEISKLYSKGINAEEVASFSYTQKKELEHSEGFAEYVRAWLTNYKWALDKAPNFTKDFEALLNSDKKFGRKMFSLQIKMHKWYKQGDKARLIEGISGESNANKSLSMSERIMRLRSMELGAEFKQNAFDYLHAAKVMSRSTKGGLTTGTTEPYKLLQLLNGADQMFAESYLRGAPYYKEDGSVDFKGISLNNVWGESKKAGNERMKDQEAYFAARRAEEAVRKGTEKLFTKGMIKEGLALGNKYPYFKKAFSDFQKFNKSMLQFYVDSGYISQDSMNAFLKNNKAYVAFHRAISATKAGEGTGSNIGARQSGAEESILHIYENTVKQTGIHMAAALKARAMRDLYMQTLPSESGDVRNSGALFITKATSDTKPIMVDIDQMADSILQVGTENEIDLADMELEHNGQTITDRAGFIEYLKDNPDLLKFWTFGHPPTDRRTEFDSYIGLDGKTKWVQINEDNTLLPSMLNALGGIHLPQNKITRAALKAPIVFKNIITVGITSAWQFAGGNLPRDSTTAMALSGFKFKPVYHHLIGLGYMVESVWNANGLVGELRGNGGYSGGRMKSALYENWGLTGSNTEYLSEKEWYRSPTRIAKEILLAYTKVADVTEMATRVGFYYRQRKAGIDPVEAAWQTRQITTDFQKRGANPHLAYAVRTSAFLNAGMQGFMREMEAIFEVNGEMNLSNIIKDEDGLMKLTSLKARMYGVSMTLAGLSMLSAYLMLYSDDKEEREIYRNLTPDERARFIHLPGGAKIAKPIGVFGLAMALPEISINEFLNDKEDRPDFMTSEVLFALGHHMVLAGSPTILEIPLDLATGKDWKGAPIVPIRLEGVAGFEQYDHRTGLAFVEASKQLKEKFNISLSPIMSEYVVKNLIGYYSDYTKEYTDRLFWDYENWGERPFQKGFADISFRQYKKDKRIYRNRYTMKFYDLYSEAMEATKTFKVATDHFAENGSESYKKNFGNYEHQVSALGVEMQALGKEFNEWQKGTVAGSRNPNLTSEEKEQAEIKRLNTRNKVFEQQVTEFTKQLKEVKAAEAKMKDDAEEKERIQKLQNAINKSTSKAGK